MKQREENNMELIIDSRENKLLDFIPDCKKEYLAIGDILFKTGFAEILVERKTWTDLWSSIHDGRYREQRSRLLEWSLSDQGKHVVYLIEGIGQECLEKEAMETCQRALHRLMIAYKIPVIFTTNVGDSARWIQWVHSKQDIQIFLRTMDSQQERVENVQQRFDKKTIQNPKNMLITFLRSISGVSYPMAQLIADKYTSISDFVAHKEQLEESIASIEYETSTKKMRKIGPKMAKKILELLG